MKMVQSKTSQSKTNHPEMSQSETSQPKATQPKTIRVLSLGAGVQSSTLALMAARGEFDSMPVAAVFADTLCEEARTYRWLDTLEKLLPYPVIRVSAGNLEADFLHSLRTGKRCDSPPFFVLNELTGTKGVLWRKCTQAYKIRMIRREAKRLKKEHHAQRVEQWIGISWDEAHRMRDSGARYIQNKYPLVDRWITRKHCLDWMLRNGFPKPPKSACYFCPYHDERFWHNMKIHRPREFRRAVQFELEVQKILRKTKYFDRPIFLHRSGVHLDKAVFNLKDRQSPFGNECEGMCGV